MTTRIIIEAVSPDKQRLPCYTEEFSGDWYHNPGNGDLHIRVTAADVWDQEDAFLVALHELIEARLCFKAGVTQGEVDKFDLAFTGDDEPGDQADAPYQKQHRQACLVEHMMALFLGNFAHGHMD